MGLPVCNAVNRVDLAAYDLARWWVNSVSIQLPNPTATVSCPASPVGNPAPVSCTVQISWTEKAVAMNSSEAATEQPEANSTEKPKRTARLHAVRRAMNTYTPTHSFARAPAARLHAGRADGHRGHRPLPARRPGHHRAERAHGQSEPDGARAAAGRAALCHDRDHGCGAGRRLLRRPHDADERGLPAGDGPLRTGWIFAGSHTVGAADNVAHDTIATRFRTPSFRVAGHGPILCDGTDTSRRSAETSRSSSR